jgi:hypothetical protein
MMGSDLQGYNVGPDGPAAFLSRTENDFQAGKEVAVCSYSTVSSGSGLVESHCYLVDSIQSGRWWQVTVTLRNPWGGSDEFITVSASVFEASFWSEASAYV